MDQKRARLGLIAVLATTGLLAAPVEASPAQGEEPETTMSEDARRMHERLMALGAGEGSTSELRIELMDGGMASHRSYVIEAGKLASQEWPAPGAAMIRREGRVADARLAELLRQLIAKQYWRFQGTRFTPDAPTFSFRFYYGELTPVDFRCDAEELRRSEPRAAIRSLFLELVSETEMTTVSPNR